jgi:hypothetical protein
MKPAGQCCRLEALNDYVLFASCTVNFSLRTSAKLKLPDGHKVCGSL